MLTFFFLPGYVLNGIAAVGLIFFYLARSRAVRESVFGAERVG